MKIVGVAFFTINMSILARVLSGVYKTKPIENQETDDEVTQKYENINIYRVLDAVFERAEIASLADSPNPPENIYERNRDNISECIAIANIALNDGGAEDKSSDNVVHLHRDMQKKQLKELK
ncbi:hypothetical protein [Pseudoalteromonas sp. S16_S37]|uniref:hypothetical protein n=1 Tax=Pseudoalteromonas sp. S16_S37 TaxID=2720228 RepID=UPI0016817E73|nr:hypothetical protein [Pseudoalteromonas sp. S16_S37]MBD1583465.1 hypothetical protein [Pseudoalteromonas sp. S16_S37]